MQGQRDLATVSRLIMSELTPTVNAQHGAFFLAEPRRERRRRTGGELALVASYGYKKRKNVSNRFKPGEALVGQAALEKKPILITEPPEDYVKVTSGLGEAAPRTSSSLPVLFEEQVLGVIELASFRAFDDTIQHVPRPAHGDDRRRAHTRSSPTCARRSCCSSRSRSRRSCSRSPRSSSRSRTSSSAPTPSSRSRRSR